MGGNLLLLRRHLFVENAEDILKFQGFVLLVHLNQSPLLNHLHGHELIVDLELLFLVCGRLELLDARVVHLLEFHFEGYS